MFLVEAIADFSKQTINQPEQQVEKQQVQQNQSDENQPLQKQANESDDDIKSKKRSRTKQQKKELQRQSQQKKQEDNQEEGRNQTSIKYTFFKEGDKILVKQTFENGWWLGHPVGKPELQGFFPSNFVKIGIKPPAPTAPKKPKKEEEEQQPQYDPNDGVDWIKKQLDQVKTGPVKSQYYQGIKGYKMVKIDEKNQNILKGNHVQFDVATGLAKVPVKDQAPAAKAVRQMGYYFDYHQWNEQRNHNPQKKARPDPKKKKAKKLNLKMMD